MYYGVLPARQTIQKSDKVLQLSELWNISHELSLIQCPERMNNDPRGWTNGALKLFYINMGHPLRWSWFCWNSQLGHGAFEAARRFMYEIPISFLAAKDLPSQSRKICKILWNHVFGPFWIHPASLYSHHDVKSWILLHLGDLHPSSQTLLITRGEHYQPSEHLLHTKSQELIQTWPRKAAGWSVEMLCLIHCHLYVDQYQYTMEMSCLHQYRIQKGCSMMPRYLFLL